MSLGIGRAFGAALKGTLKGVYEGGIVPEDARREKYTTAALNANVKKALKLEDERIKANKASREEIEQVKALEGMTNLQGKVLSEAERTKVVQTMKATGMDFDDVMEGFEIVSDKDAKVTPGKPVIYKLGEVSAMEVEEGTGWFSAGRNQQISEDVAKLLKMSGVDTEVSVPTPNTVEGVRLTPKQKDAKYEGFDYGTFTIEKDGQAIIVQGILNPELSPNEGRLYLDPETNSYKPVPPEGKWNGKTATKTITKMDASDFEVNQEYANNAIKQDTKLAVNSAKYNEGVASGQILMDGLDRLAKIALRDESYASLTSFFGNVSKGIKNEIAGFKFVFQGDDVSEQEAYEADTLNIRNTDGTVNLGRASKVMDALETQYNSIAGALSNAEDVASNRKLMEIMALRMAIAEIVVDGDARPSDFDVQSRMGAYLATSKKGFLKLANETIRATQSKLDARRKSLMISPAITLAVKDANNPEYTAQERAAAERFVSGYAPSFDRQIKLPSFTEEGFDTSQFVDPPKNIDQPTVETFTKEDGQQVKRVIMSDGSYLKDENGVVLELPSTTRDEAILKFATERATKGQE